MQYSIEFAHIYLDEYIAMEHVLGKEKLLEIRKYRELNRCNSTIINLIDDYNATKNKLNLKKFEDFLNEHLDDSVEVIYESDMIFYSHIALTYLSHKDSKSYLRYINKFNRYPCSLLALTSYLIRLGIIETKFPVRTADKLINILSERFRGVEDMIKKYLRRSSLSGIEKKIETIYIRATDGLYTPNA